MTAPTFHLATAVGIAAAAVVYLAGAAVGSVAPTPGGLGAVEVALSTGLVAVGVPSTAAISGVLLFRLATFWLPVPLGAIALRGLRRQSLDQGAAGPRPHRDVPHTSLPDVFLAARQGDLAEELHKPALAQLADPIWIR